MDAQERAAHFVLREVGRPMREFRMIAPGDRVGVAVSGGKDSLALLDLLNRYRTVARCRFELTAVHVRGDSGGITEVHGPLDAHLRCLGIPFRFVAPGSSPASRPHLGATGAAG
jgi:hypothetical protein